MVVEPLPAPPQGDRSFAPQGDRRLAIALLLAGVACLGMGQTIVFAVLPPLARSIGLHDMQVAAIFMLSAILWVTLSPFWGRRSDRFGRKPFILLGLFGFAVSMTLFATTLGLGLKGVLGGIVLYALMICTRSIYGVIGSATPSAAQAYIADRTPIEKRTAGISGFSAAFGFGAMIGPGLGGAVSAIGPLTPLYAVAALAAVMIALIFFLLPEHTRPIEHRVQAHLSLKEERLRPFLVFALVFGVINAVPIQMGAFYLIDVLKLTPEEAPQYAGIGLMGAAMASLFSQLVLVQRFGVQPHLLMRIAPALIMLGHILIVVSSDFGPIVFGLVLSGFGAGMAIPGYTGAASLAVGSDEQGAATGLANAAGGSGFFIAPPLVFWLYSYSPHAPFVLTAALAAGLLVFAWMNAKIRQSGRFAKSAAAAPLTPVAPEDETVI